MVLNLKKLESPSPKDALCQFRLKLTQRFWRIRYLNFVNVFSLFRNHLPLEKGVALHLNKFESPLSKDALCQVWLKLAQWFWGRFFNFVNYIFSLFHHYFPLEKVGALRLPKLNSPSPKDDLCLVWLILAQWLWRRWFFNSSMHFSQFRTYHLLEKDGPYLNKLECPSPKDALLQVWLKLA